MTTKEITMSKIKDFHVPDYMSPVANTLFVTGDSNILIFAKTGNQGVALRVRAQGHTSKAALNAAKKAARVLVKKWRGY